MAKQTVEFPTTAYETGDKNAPSIKPYEDNEPVTAAVLTRPPEVLRVRTEVLRAEIEGLKYLADADRALLLTCVGRLAVQSSATGYYFTTTEDIVVRPFIGPGSLSTRAYVDLGSQTPGSMVRITATGLRSYNRPLGASASDFSVSANDCTAMVTLGTEQISFYGTPARHFDITSPATQTVTQLKDALNVYFANNALPFTATVVGNVTAKVGAVARTGFSRALDNEQHVVTAAALSEFFRTEASHLKDGDTLAITYATLVASAGYGGRRQSINEAPENATAAKGVYIPAASLANLRVNPEKAPLAIPICTRVGDSLVFAEGTPIKVGVTASLGGLSQGGGTLGGDMYVEGSVTARDQLIAETTTEAPLVVSSQVKVTNLNVDYLRGGTWADPKADIGSDTTAVAGTFTTLTAKGALKALSVNVNDKAAVSSEGAITGTSLDVGTGTANTGALSVRTAASPTAASVTVVKAATQTTALTEWVSNDATPTVYAKIDASGKVWADAGAEASTLTVTGQSTLSSTTITGANVIKGKTASDTPLEVRGAARTGTAYLQAWYNALTGGSALASIDKSGKLTCVGADAGAGALSGASAVINGRLEADEVIASGTVKGATVWALTTLKSEGTLTVASTAEITGQLTLKAGAAVTGDVGITGDVALKFGDSNKVSLNNDGTVTAVGIVQGSQLRSTVATNTPPLIVTSTTKVPNLNVDKLDGYDWASPAAIGTGKAEAGTFTALTATESATLTNVTISGTFGLPSPLALSEGGTGVDLRSGSYRELMGWQRSFFSGIDEVTWVPRGFSYTTDDRTYSEESVPVPGWAKTICIICIGGGGGGGSGAYGNNDNLGPDDWWSAAGGGGGGGGGVTQTVVPVPYNNGLLVTVGEGGDGAGTAGSTNAFYGANGSPGGATFVTTDGSPRAVLAKALGGTGGLGGVRGSDGTTYAGTPGVPGGAGTTTGGAGGGSQSSDDSAAAPAAVTGGGGGGGGFKLSTGAGNIAYDGGGGGEGLLYGSGGTGGNFSEGAQYDHAVQFPGGGGGGGGAGQMDSNSVSSDPAGVGASGARGRVIIYFW